MKWLWALSRENADDQDRELGKRGPVLDRDGEPGIRLRVLVRAIEHGLRRQGFQLG